MWCVPPLPVEQLTIDGIPLPSVDAVRDLGVHLDSDMLMATHITQLVNSCFAALRQIRSIRRSLPRSALSTLATSFIMTRVDYCNVVLAGLPQCELQRLQTVVNAAARLTAGAQKYDHVTPLLKDLHWLRVPERITFKLCALAFRCLNNSAPQYLSELLQPVADLGSRQRLRSSSTFQLVVPCMRRSTIGDRAFTVAAPRAWNSLPDSLHRLSSLEQFKKLLKTHLFKISFAQQDSF